MHIHLYTCLSNFTENFQKQILYAIHVSILIILAHRLLADVCWIDE